MIIVDNVEKSYKKKKVLDKITFEAKSGQMIAIVGDNGTGKSTLLQIMSGLLPADAGSISYYGQRMKKKDKRFVEYCGYVAQTNGLMEELSVRDNLSLWTGSFQVDKLPVVEWMGLQGLLHTPVHKLSGGMKRRVAIACAVANEPPILLLDEPTAALDQTYQVMIRDFMKSYTKRNGILVVATHDIQEIQMADIVITI